MRYTDIRAIALTFQWIAGPCYVAEYGGHEIGLKLGDYPPAYAYNVFIDKVHVHSSDYYPAQWSLDSNED